ncbi:MAG: hypothetical protein HC881_14915, partial [Leptolyngbyaceae cyanobacterium SL_7_1]|nr:hypothetical protein [Leptolyngbyaceae cyanobacterium SL_7_1]
MDASPRESAGEMSPISPEEARLDATDPYQYPAESLAKLRPHYWWIWTGATLLLTGSVSFWAIAQLLGLPDLPNCWMVSPRSKPSVRLYCAEVFADRGTVDLLGRAIELASELPDPALSPRGDQLALQWTESMLRLAESKFQQGNLEEALTIASKIPTTRQIRSQVNAKTSEWKAIWAKAEEIYSTTLLAIEDRNWDTTINTARQLFLVGNEFWASSKYQELMEKMRIAKEENQWRQNVASPRPLPSSS